MQSNETELFERGNFLREPLASRMRPRTLDEYVGQEKIVGKGRLLRRAIQADRLSSAIFYGPPGSGKTTLARVIANHTKSNFITLNAVLSGVADIRDAIKNANDFFHLYSRKTILFVDEVHRWNKAQQDALLPWVENGTIILIGATTENPYFEVNKALVSRSRIFELELLSNDEMKAIADQALSDKERGYGNWNVEFEQGALSHVIETAGGDARSLLNALELAIETSVEQWNGYGEVPVPPYGTTIFISTETAEQSIQKKVVLYDRDGDYHYDIISAFIKSLRGRDPDAALYWLSKMVAAGEDAHFIFRRMLISASEDTGLADPNAICVVESCAAAFDRVGMPEGRYFLTEAALYLSTCEKSNSALGFFDALKLVQKENADVPNHLKDASRDGKGLGHGDGYLYPHSYREHWVSQQYLPTELQGKIFYSPSMQGYEKKIHDAVLSRREAQMASYLEKEADIFLQKNSQSKNLWEERTLSNRNENLLEERELLFALADLQKNNCSLVWKADDALLLWELNRKTPDGLTCGICKTDAARETLLQYATSLDELEKPFIKLSTNEKPFASLESAKAELHLFDEEEFVFDRIFFRNPFMNKSEITNFAETLQSFSLAKKSRVVLSQVIYKNAQRLSEFLKSEKNFSEAEIKKMQEAEDDFFSDESRDFFSFDETKITCELTKTNFSAFCKTKQFIEKRHLHEKEIRAWFSEKSTYGSNLAQKLGASEIEKIANYFLGRAHTTFEWKTTVAFFVIEPC